MPESLSALTGGVTGASTDTQAVASTKKKLRKVGNVWTDDAGNFYTDESGGGKAYSSASEAERAATSEPTNAMSMLDQADEVGKKDLRGGENYSLEPKSALDQSNTKPPVANPNPDLATASAVWDAMKAKPTNEQEWGDKDSFISSWKYMTDKERALYKAILNK